jgi:hypothetical protein
MPTESQLHDPALRTLIRRRMDAGELPLVLSRTISVRSGSGLDCAACSRPIERQHIEYHAFGVRYGTAVRLHWGCHVLWQLECVERTRHQGRGGAQSSPGPIRQGEPEAGENSPGNLTCWEGAAVRCC